MRLQGGALSFGFASGRELERFHICAVVSATARRWECDLRSWGDAVLVGLWLQSRMARYVGAAFYFFFGGSRRLCAVGCQTGERWHRVGRYNGGAEFVRRTDPYFLEVVRKRIRG